MSFDLEKVRAAINSLLAEGWDNDAATVRELVAEIERLRGEMENYGDDYVCQMKSKDARIQELEDALVEDRARGDLYCENLLDWDDYDYKAYTWPKDAIPGYKHFSEADITEFRENARQQLQTEGKIGPDADECPDDLPPIGSPYRSWEVTEERKEALDRVLDGLHLHRNGLRHRDQRGRNILIPPGVDRVGPEQHRSPCSDALIAAALSVWGGHCPVLLTILPMVWPVTP